MKQKETREKNRRNYHQRPLSYRLSKGPERACLVKNAAGGAYARVHKSTRLPRYANDRA